MICLKNHQVLLNVHFVMLQLPPRPTLKAHLKFCHSKPSIESPRILDSLKTGNEPTSHNTKATNQIKVAIEEPCLMNSETQAINQIVAIADMADLLSCLKYDFVT